MAQDLKEVLEFQIRRNTNRLCKSLLIKLEDLKFNQEILQQQVEQSIPEEFRDNIELLKLINEKQFVQLRKRILDYGNDHIRDLLSEIENYKIEFNFKR